jgi:hypothetical protein
MIAFCFPTDGSRADHARLLLERVADVQKWNLSRSRSED